MDSLLAWYSVNKRDLPWRRTSNPYAIWVSEIMLQQTQVTTVIPYWHRWMSRFPTVESLASAEEQEVLAMWQGLGYYRRCRMLQLGAKYVASHGIPDSAEAWLLVPGVGAYTAGAIASIALGQTAALVDGNVERVYARLTGDTSSSTLLNKNAWIWARANVHGERPGDWNQALMELGATICTPTKPACDRCPLSTQCIAFRDGIVDQLPVRPTKPKTIQLTHVVWVPLFEGELGLRQVPKGDWWQGMWEFPREEIFVGGHDERKLVVNERRAVATVNDLPNLRALVGCGEVQFLGEIKHTVTNHRITIRANVVRCESRSDLLSWRRPDALISVPMSAPQRKVLNLALASFSL